MSVKSNLLVLVAVGLCSTSAFGQTANADYCRGFSRKVSIPATLVRYVAKFKDPDTSAVGTGMFHGWTYRAIVSVTNVGTLPQTIRVEMTELEVLATIRRKGGAAASTTQYQPSPWKAGPETHNAAMTTVYGPTKVSTMRREMILQPGDTARMGLGIECRFDTEMSGCEVYDARNDNFVSFIPTYTERPSVLSMSANGAVRICVKGPQGKEALGAINGSLNSDVYSVQRADPGFMVETDDSSAALSNPILSGFPF